jgi:zinc transporter ZupT
MDLETIKRINRDALRAAQESEAGESGQIDNKQIMTYAVAVAAAALVYFLLQTYKPEFVLSTKDGVKTFDQMRAILSALAAGLLVILGFQFLN